MHWTDALDAGLAQNKYLDDDAFVAYLSYLQYWKHPNYAKYVQ
jgi:mediator of RNA polymerase II transcription subunit 31